ncbi:hypothetical protein B0H13DRAFT_1925908 [Mycena leptocephala]|nr:hypothetical protein B0H13DRAFT_1925908 [Mycena leptocephala]
MWRRDGIERRGGGEPWELHREWGNYTEERRGCAESNYRALRKSSEASEAKAEWYGEEEEVEEIGAELFSGNSVPVHSAPWIEIRGYLTQHERTYRNSDTFCDGLTGRRDETVHRGAAVKSKDPNKEVGLRNPSRCVHFSIVWMNANSIAESPGDDNSDFDKASAWPGVIDFEKPAVFSVSGRPQPTRGLNGRRSAGNASRDDGALITDGCKLT